MMNEKQPDRSPTQADQRHPVVLIVDDTPANLKALSSYFESLGFEIMMAQNGPTAIKRTQYVKPDIILLDVIMPGMDGFELCRRFKADDATKNIPIIFMTALNDTVHKIKGFEVGAADYITKPFQIEEVWARVQTHLSLRTLQIQLEAQNKRLQAEIHDRQQTANALREAIEQQEQRVKQRTAELALANSNLKAEISERRQAEIEIRHLAAEMTRRVESRTNELSALYRVTALAKESLELDSILDRALASVLEVAQVSQGTIHLTGESIQLAVQSGFASEEQAKLFTHTNAAWIAMHDQSLFKAAEVGQPSEDTRVIWYLGLPIRAESRVLGVLSILLEKDQNSEVDPNLISLLTAIGDHIGIVLESIRLREKAEQAATLEERSRLARELHDSVTQLMYSINLFSRAGKDAYRLNHNEQGEKYLIRLEDIARQALKELRLLLYELRPPELEQEGLVGALQKRLDAVEGRAGINTKLRVNIDAEMPQHYEEALYAIAQEALNNILKHANATLVTIELTADSEQIQLTINDNGRGFNIDDANYQGGMGMDTMRERAAALGGDLHVHSKLNHETTVRLILATPEYLLQGE